MDHDAGLSTAEGAALGSVLLWQTPSTEDEGVGSGSDHDTLLFSS